MKDAQFRIALLTLAVGLTGVHFFNRLDEKWSQPIVDLPKAQFAPMIYIFPELRKQMPFGSGDYSIINHKGVLAAEPTIQLIAPNVKLNDRKRR